jgi:signal transduction histidine kinase
MDDSIHKTPAEGSEGQRPRTDPVNNARILAASLDGLVRACRARSAAVGAIAERILVRWAECPDVVFRIEATSLLVGEEEVLSGEDEEGRWLLPAFMAGLKSIGVAEAPDAADLVRLGSELAALGPSLPSIHRFRDWLWSEGAEGFEVLLDYGFSEGLDAALTDLDRQREMLRAMRAEAASSLSAGARRIASADLDAAAARSEFETPLTAYERKLDEERLRLDAGEASSLARACDDSVFWIDAQVFLSLAYPELQSLIPPERMARRMLSLVSAGGSGRFVSFLVEMRRRKEPYARQLLDALETEAAGEALGCGVALGDAEIKGVGEILLAPATPLSRALACRLLERCCGSAESMRWLAHLMASTGFEAYWAKVDPGRLSERCALLVARLLLACKAPHSIVGDLLQRSPPASGARLALALPLDLLARLKQPVMKLLSTAAVKDAEALVTRLVGDGCVDWSAVLGTVAQASHGSAWPLPVFRMVCAAVQGRGGASGYLVPIVRSREASDEVKLTALRFIEKDAAALEALARGRIGKLLESRDVRDAIKAALRRREES